MSSTSRSCRSCNARLSRHNRTTLCATCERRSGSTLVGPPELPAEFWESGELAGALAARHMGKVSRAYRQHPLYVVLHGHRGLPQSVLAGWLGLTQAQVSRVETGPPSRNLDVLTHWATVLRIPPAHLWFDPPMPDAPTRTAPRTPDFTVDPTVLRSQHEWRGVRRYLNDHRSELGHAASRLYPQGVRIEGTALLSPSHWMPDEPIELGRLSLNWLGEAGTAAVVGTEPEAHDLLPLRTPRSRYERYTSSVRYVESPALFENRPSYRLVDVSWTASRGNMTFGLASYFDKLDISEALGHECAIAAMKAERASVANGVRWEELPFRRIVEPFDLGGRHVVPAVTTLTLCRDRDRGTLTFLLHWRDPARVATAGGVYDVIPAGEFQPSSIAPWAGAADLDIWKNMVREYSEELCGMPEHDGSSSTPVDYERWPFYRAMTHARSAGRIRAYCLGVGVDALTLAATILTVVVIDSDALDEIFGQIVTANAEGTTVRSLSGSRTGAEGIVFDEQTVRRVLAHEPLAAPGAACLSLAWRHRATILDGVAA